VVDVRLNLRTKVMVVVLLPLVVLWPRSGSPRRDRCAALSWTGCATRRVARRLMVEIVGPDVALRDNTSLDEKLGFVADRDFASVEVQTRRAICWPRAPRTRQPGRRTAADRMTRGLVRAERDGAGHIEGQPLGTVVVRLSKANLDADQARTRSGNSRSSICLLFAIAAAALVSRRILRRSAAWRRFSSASRKAI